MAVYIGERLDGKGEHTLSVEWTGTGNDRRLRVGIRTKGWQDKDPDWQTNSAGCAVYFKEGDLPPILWSVLISLAWPPPD